MNPMKKLGMAVMLLVGVGLVASTPAQAADTADYGPFQLWNTGAEPQASGEATLERVRLRDYPSWGKVYTGYLTVTCQNLTPGASYSTPVGTFKADRTGEGSAKGMLEFAILWDGFDFWPFPVNVVRLDPDGSSTVVLMKYFMPG